MAITEDPTRAADAPPPPETERGPRISAGFATALGALAVFVIATTAAPTWVTAHLYIWVILLACALALAAVPLKRAPVVLAALLGAWFLAEGAYEGAKNIRRGPPVDVAVGG